VRLESGERTLHLAPPADLKVELAARQKSDRGRITLEIGWKHRTGSRATELRVQAGARPDRS
jgi:hypothetical protein